MVIAEIADVHVQRHRALLGPGVDAQMRFGQQHRGGDATGAQLALVQRCGKAVEQLGHGLQTRFGHGLQQVLAQGLSVGQPLRRAVAAVEIGGQVQALHAGTVEHFLA